MVLTICQRLTLLKLRSKLNEVKCVVNTKITRRGGSYFQDFAEKFGFVSTISDHNVRKYDSYIPNHGFFKFVSSYTPSNRHPSNFLRKRVMHE